MPLPQVIKQPQDHYENIKTSANLPLPDLSHSVFITFDGRFKKGEVAWGLVSFHANHNTLLANSQDYNGARDAENQN